MRNHYKITINNEGEYEALATSYTKHHKAVIERTTTYRDKSMLKRWCKRHKVRLKLDADYLDD